MSTFVDATSGAVEHCEAMAALHADLASDYEQIAKYVSSKLWHQLTLKLLDLLQSPNKLRTTSDGTSSFLALYNEVVLKVEKKLHPLSLARLASAVASSLLPSDGTASRALLENLLEQTDRLGAAATLYAESRLGLLQLALLERTGVPMDMDQLKEQLKTNETKLQELPLSQDPDGLVHSAFYECSMTYYKAVGPPEAYYKQALNYLNYTPSIEHATSDPQQLAIDLSLAALTGDGVYNLSQVVETPLLKLLEGTPHVFLLELLQSMSDGNVVLFHDLCRKHQAQIQQQPALTHRLTQVQEKMTLLALVHLVFERPSGERTLRFEDIAARLQVASVDQVEWVVMRALSVGLIEGTMDQVDQTVQVTWILPRVLTNAQMQALATRYGEWAVRVSQTRDYMKEQTSTLLV